jgi:enediyne biosynthesis protein E4
VVRITDEKGRRQWQTVTTASSYLSASQKRVHFGLGDAVGVAEVEVRWPSGTVQVFRKPEVNRRVTLREVTNE